MAILTHEYDFLTFCSVACDRDNDIPGWERKPPCLL
jgi:NADPH-dependent glutamate synthase beta subunit-like oxidoreductase